jgi:hypothetical protein
LVLIVFSNKGVFVMARIEWVRQRLYNWALWVARENSTGLGYARQSVLLAEPCGGYRDPVMPVNDPDGELTNQAVQSLHQPHPEIYETLVYYYLRGDGIKRTARLEGVCESTVHARLDRADHLLSEWFGRRAEAKKDFDRGLST